MLCISGFVNDVMFLHNGPNTGIGLESVTWRIIHLDSPDGAAELRPRGQSPLSPIAVSMSAVFCVCLLQDVCICNQVTTRLENLEISACLKMIFAAP